MTAMTDLEALLLPCAATGWCNWVLPPGAAIGCCCRVLLQGIVSVGGFQECGIAIFILVRVFFAQFGFPLPIAALPKAPRPSQPRSQPVASTRSALTAR